MNYTVDDTFSEIDYSPGWGVQPSTSSSSDIQEYFERTYHVAEQDGATLNFTFSASAVAIFGSTGPGHADFDIQFDNDVLTGQTAWASQTGFQQLLFQRDFSSSGTVANHFISLKAVFTERGTWLDVDFIMLTNGNVTTSATTSAAVETITPPYLSATTSSFSPSTSSTIPTATASADTSSAPKTTTVLAGLFGGIIGLALLLVAIWAFMRHVYYRCRRREHAFRLGAPPPNTTKSSAFSEAISGASRKYTRGATSTSYGGTAAGGSVASFSLHNPFGSGSRDPSASQVNLDMSNSSLCVGVGHALVSERDHRAGYTSVSMRSTPPPDASMQRMGSGTPAMGGGPGGAAASRGADAERRAGTPLRPMQGPAVREFLTGSPILWAGAKHKGDADSLRTDFLQV